MKYGTLAIVAVLAAGLLTCLGCDSTTDTRDPEDETGVVRGWVRHRYTLQAIAGAAVTCVDRVTTSDAAGHFELAGLPRDTTSIAAAAEGYQSLHTLVDVRSFQTVMLDMVPLDTLADVSGSVRHPLHGAVSAAVMLGSRGTVADQAGHWTLADVPLGQHALVIAHPAYVAYATSVVIHGDGQEILAILQRDSTLVAPITADAGIHWSPDDGDENNYGDEVELSLRWDPPRSVLLAIPIAPGPDGAAVHAAALHLYGYLEVFMPPLPESLTLELRAVHGVWYETSVDATNFPADVGLPQTRIAALTAVDSVVRLDVDVTPMFAGSQTGPATGVLVSHHDEHGPPMLIFTRDTVPSSWRPWLSITVRY